MKKIAFDLIINGIEIDLTVEIPWKVVPYDTGKGYEIFPELEDVTIKIPKVNEDYEVEDSRDLQSITLKHIDYEIHSPDITGDRAVIITPDSIDVDLDEQKATVKFKLI